MKTKTDLPTHEPIAIVGMSCRFPNSESIDGFWDLLKNGKHTISEIPKERWDMSKYYDLDPQANRKTYQKDASLLKGIHDFDPLFFNISPAEATEMSPSQKLMLELAWESMENSSIPYEKIQGRNVGVFVGNIWGDFEHLRKEKNAKATLHSAVGMSNSVVANRVSFTFGFKGTSLVIDTGCSSSLVALHMACNSIRVGESKMAIVAGINHILDPDKYIELTQFGGLSKKGMCSSFDIDADGFVRGEGGGALLLKPLSEAEKDGDKIHAIIRGSAANNNGYNGTLPATSVEGQKELLETAYKNAGIAPNEVHYVEAHGTGTKLGDPNEARAIGEFFSTNRDTPLHLGSVKTNIGHTEATAGIAGLIKVVLGMKNNLLAPNLNFNVPNPNIPFDDLKLKVQNEPTPWPRKGNETLKAGINSFGWGGTNAHAVVEEYIPTSKVEKEIEREEFLLPISAKSTQALRDYTKSYLTLFDGKTDSEIKSICVATAIVKPEFDIKVLFKGSSITELLEEMNAFIQDDEELNGVTFSSEEEAKMVFVFPGQGSQWLGMGKELIKTDKVFKNEIEAIDKAYSAFTDWSLIDQLNATEETSRLSEINVIQPAICAIQIALAKLWRSWGIEPKAVIGHSMGEVAAAHVAGVLTLEDAAKVICTRSSLMKTVSGQGGAMIVSELNVEEAQKVVEKYPGKISLGVNNSYKSTVLSGDKACIDEILADLEAKELFCRLIKVDVASHSPQMDPLKDELKKALATIKPQKATVKFASTVRNKFMEGPEMDATYWVENLRNTVQFAAAAEKLLEEDFNTFLEVNPHPVLINAVNECAEFSKKKIVATASTVREKPEKQMILNSLSQLYSTGYLLDWSFIWNTEIAPHHDLPYYPYERETYEIKDMSLELENKRDKNTKYILLGNKISLAGISNDHYWESIITPNKFPFLNEQKLQNGIEIPMSFYMEIALEAATEVFKEGSLMQVYNLNFSKRMILPKTGGINTQVRLTTNGSDGGSVQIYMKESQDTEWAQIASCQVALNDNKLQGHEISAAPEDLDPYYTEGVQFYEALNNAGVTYGNHYQLLTGLNKIGNGPKTNILFSIKPTVEINMAAAKYKTHPTLLNSFVQPIFGQLTKVLGKGHYLDVTFTGVEQFGSLSIVNYERELRGLMVFEDLYKIPGTDNKWGFNANFFIANYDNTPVMTIKGLHGTCTRKDLAKQTDKISKEQNLLTNYLVLGDKEKIDHLQDILIEAVSKIIKTPANRIKKTMTFKNMGLDSLMAVQLRNVLEKKIKQKLSVSMFWNHPSIQQYTEYLKTLLDEAHSVEGNVSKLNTLPKTSNWFTIPSPNSEATSRIFCFHDAGGSTSLFNQWGDHFKNSDIEVVLIELPGHGKRVEESLITNIDSFLNDFMPDFNKMMDKPFAFLGHSMGGLIAFEVIRELRRKQLAQPMQLFISSTSGLTAYNKSSVDYRLPNEKIVEQYPHLHLDVIQNKEMQEMLITILKADLQLLYDYEYKKEMLLDIPITVFHGESDKRVKIDQIEQWEKETLSSFKLFSRPGGHRFIQNDGEFVTSIIKQEILAIINLKSVKSA